MITAICIDNNPIDLSIIKTILSNNSQLTLKNSFSNPEEAILYLKSTKIDLLFTDIEMGELNGLEVLNKLENKPMVVFISAHPKYAAESFQFEPLNYIVKPVTEIDIITSIERGYNRLKGVSTKGYIIIKSSYSKFIKILQKDILFIESDKDYLKIVCIKDKYRTLYRIKDFKLQLPHNFVQVHRSYIVNLNSIDSVLNNTIEISDNQIPISRLYKKEFLQTLNQHKPTIL